MLLQKTYYMINNTKSAWNTELKTVRDYKYAIYSPVL